MKRSRSISAERPQYRRYSNKRSYNDRGPLDPQSVDYLVSFREFAAWTRHQFPEIDEEALNLKYQAYKETFNINLVQTSFKQLQDENWFIEKYHPLISKDIVKDSIVRRSDLFTAFSEQLKKGEFDDIQFDEPQKEAKEYEEELQAAIASQQLSKQKIYSDTREFPTLVLDRVPLSVSRATLIQKMGEFSGFKQCFVSDPDNRLVHRSAFCLFDSMENAQAAVGQIEIQDYKVNAFKYKPPVNTVWKTVPYFASTQERMELDLKQIKMLADTMEKEISVYDSVESKAIREYFAKDLKKELDFYILYLLQVFQYDYYSGKECLCPEEIAKNISSLRRTVEPGYVSREADVFYEKLDSRVAVRISCSDQGSEIVKLGGKSVEYQVEKEIARLTRQEEEEKFKCRECGKLFKGPEFVAKHIRNKHADVVERWTLEFLFLNAYARDPNRLFKKKSSEYHRPREHSRQSDPRGLKSYVDLDAPAAGEMTINYD